MEKSFFEQMSGTYHQEGDYLLPELAPPESVPIGIWGQRQKHCLKTQREPIYTALLLSGKLDSHLSEVGAQAEAMFFSWLSNWRSRRALQNSSKPTIICQKEQHFIQHEPSDLEDYFSALPEKVLFCGLCRHAVTFLFRGRKLNKTWLAFCKSGNELGYANLNTV